MMPQKVEWCFSLHIKNVLGVSMTVAMLYLCIDGGQCQQCGFENYPDFVDLTSGTFNPPGFISHPSQFLVNGVEFSCTGYIQQWELYCSSTGTHPIEFHVWRESAPGSNVYSLVGRNCFQDSRPDNNNLLSLSVPQAQQIQVQPGDIVGIRTFISALGTRGQDYRIQGHVTFGMTHTILRYNDVFQGDDDPTPGVLDLDGDGVIEFSLHVVPVMRITIADMPGSGSGSTTSVTTTTVSLSTDADCMSKENDSTIVSSTEFSTDDTVTSDSLPTVHSSQFPLVAIIAIATSVSVVVIIILLLTAIVLIVCCCCVYGQDSSSENKSDTPNHQNTRRITQSRETTDLGMESNVAYYSSSGISNCTQNAQDHTQPDHDLEAQYNSLYASLKTDSSALDKNNYSFAEDYTSRRIQRDNDGSVYYSKIPERGKLPVWEDEDSYTEMN